MDVEFADDNLDRLETDARYSAGFDQAIVKGFRRRMQNIRAATDERDLYAIKGNRFEKLKGTRSGQCSLMVTGNWRLIVELKSSPNKGTIVRIIEIVDYH
ncbi:MAG: type II toxin-antitoxin system RelE/ParE family toxin [Roseibium sp.]|uniref:type II toxin-antitoxin system RelE/ParE family toxin n=1 Tax=Roseibium sp. TaxID=1936156 RepID=UPI0026191F6F|nr:type II toxin-antitoxin system RelE/ParE family toxin [Roseibium sp.]MCV0424684.1 type II toxin-antitoxin system RelE/ParE family toxin [Roseibium sp.]